MSDWFNADWNPPAPMASRSWELLWTFCYSDMTFAGELRFHGDVAGWEARLLRDGSLFFSHGRFSLREQAVAWADRQRRDIEAGWLDLDGGATAASV